MPFRSPPAGWGGPLSTEKAAGKTIPFMDTMIHLDLGIQRPLLRVVKTGQYMRGTGNGDLR